MLASRIAPIPTDPLTVLLAQLNAINVNLLLPLSTSNVTASAPQAFTSPAASDSTSPAVDTMVTLTGIAGQGYSGSIDCYYKRLDPMAYVVSLGYNPPYVVPGANVSDWPSFFEAFNATYKTVFSPVDYPTTPFYMPQDNEPFSAAMAPTSLLFNGTLTAQLTGVVTPALQEAVNVTALSGLIPPAPILSNVVKTTDLGGLIGPPIPF